MGSRCTHLVGWEGPEVCTLMHELGALITAVQMASAY